MPVGLFAQRLHLFPTSRRSAELERLSSSLAAEREALHERERQQAAMLEEMHRSHDEFIALAGHQLRTPLTVIQGYAEHLLDDPATTPDQRGQLEIVVRRATSMSDLIDDLFDLARLDAPLSGVASVVVDLDEVVEQSVMEHRSVAAQSGISLRAQTQPVCVLGEWTPLRRMCDALLDNAVTYSPPGGEVVVTLSHQGDDAVLVVADRGEGIPEEEMGHVFGRLYRASNAIQGHHPGTGLGLSIALATAESHGGTASAENRADGGAVLTIRLPAQVPPEATSRR